ncbi:MAG: putative 4-hydroxybenzoate polyprenyltransferase [Proteobacteria bacterium]|nr:putative 4-hydroxybenzoate polyprenyltransferase [Pseudomonadota bacterium]
MKEILQMIDKVAKYSNLVAISHSVFALPFALSSLILAQRRGELVYFDNPTFLIIVIVFAVISARTAAMAFNRAIDSDVDSQNPRTHNREIPRGDINKNQAFALTALSALCFFFFSYLLGLHCLMLAPLVLSVLLLYSYCKRFSYLSHYVLGLSLALAPAGAWWTIRPRLELTPILLSLAVLLWVSAFDILYSCQDVTFDRENGLFSIPAKFGINQSFMISRTTHLFSFIFFMLVGTTIAAPSAYYFGFSLIGLFFLGEHLLISPYDLSKINHSFFTINGVISILYLVLICSL